MSDSMRPVRHVTAEAELMGLRARRIAAEQEIAQKRNRAGDAAHAALAPLSHVAGPSKGRPAVGGGNIDITLSANHESPGVLWWLGVDRVRREGWVQGVDRERLWTVEAKYDPEAPHLFRLVVDDEAVQPEEALEMLCGVLLHHEDFAPNPDAEIPF